LKSLTDMIKGKQGRFRENLLGKRVDYSARSVIVVGPELQLHQCGLPKKIALELYQPFIIRRLKELGLADTIKSAKRMLERRDPEVWDVLEEVIYQHPVLLNRAPTLHRMGIQAFEPVLVEGNAIKIHPLVCKGFNADFDGDQMAVHLPLSVEAQAEAQVLMLSPHNIFSPANGSPIITPSQDIVLGVFYITSEREGDDGEFKTFRSPQEAMLAHEQGKVATNARVFVRLPERSTVITGDKDVNGSPIEVVSFKQLEEHKKRLDAGYEPVQTMPEGFRGRTVLTTVGRVLFNDILPPEMPFYNFPLTSKGASRVIADTYARLGRPATIALLDKLKNIGFKRSTLAGLSFGITDIRAPESKQSILDDGQKKADKIEKNYRMGAITEDERYAQLIEIWGHARKQVTDDLMEGLYADYRNKEGQPAQQADKEAMRYLNPIALMSVSGARGSVDQMRQLGGMRGLMAKPSGEIIETPIKSNFREGLSVLEYFSSTHGARKGLADTALKTADSGYLTRKLCDVAQNVVINGDDCGTLNGVTKQTVYKGETVEVPLRDQILGRVGRDRIVDPRDDSRVILEENEIITVEKAAELEGVGLDTLRVRSPLTCTNTSGVCAKCYGVDMSTGQLVEEGLAAGIIAAQSIGEPGTQLTMRTFHTGGVALGSLTERDIKAGSGGVVRYHGLNAVDSKDPDGNKVQVVLKRNGEVGIENSKGVEVERHKVPYGAYLRVKDGGKVKARDTIAEFDPHITPILAEKAGVVKLEDIEVGETVRVEQERGESQGKLIVVEHKGERHPRITITDDEGQILDFSYLPARARIEVTDGQKIPAGFMIARQPRETAGTQDITGGLPRVTELFEARKPKDPSVLSEISGEVEIQQGRRKGKVTIVVKNETGMEREHHVPQGTDVLVHAGDHVEAGDPLIRGSVLPHDILRIKGEETLHAYLLTEVQNVYRSQGVRINDKHVEVILAQMLRKVKVDDHGDTTFLPGEVVDRGRFQLVNAEIGRMVRVTEPGGTPYNAGELVEKAEWKEASELAEAEGKEPGKTRRPKPARGRTLLLGITKASLSSDSFISAASFQETTKVLTEAAMAGAQDTLVGLKENVILGHLIPAGTGYNAHQQLRVKHLVEPPVIEDVPAPRYQPVSAEVSSRLPSNERIAEMNGTKDTPVAAADAQG
jgi:DNA-directed RNA polymerase subunit beta'